MPRLFHRAVLRRVATAALAAVTLTGLLGLTASAGTIGSWNPVIAVPGIAALSPVSGGAIENLSCPTAGNCTAVGYFAGASSSFQALVVDEVNGTWQNAMAVPGTVVLNAGGVARAQAIDCSSPGNCDLVGMYRDAADHAQLFVDEEVAGVWQTATTAPGSTTLNHGSYTWADAISCLSLGNCAMSGGYSDASGNTQGFVANEVNGTWQAMSDVPGLPALNVGGDAEAYGVSCTSVANCVAGGYYADHGGSSTTYQGFLATETNGTWGSASAVPGLNALNVSGNAGLYALACPSAGNCAGGGIYKDAANLTQAFVVDEKNGTWGSATELAGSAALHVGTKTSDVTGVFALTCVSAGNCLAGGQYDGSAGIQPMVASEVAGTWQNAIELPGSGSLNADNRGWVNSVACASAGNCAAGGVYTDGSNHMQAFVDNEVNGAWQNTIEVPGTNGLSTTGNTGVSAVACATSGYCAAGGYYYTAGSQINGFLTTASAATPPTTTTTKPPVKKHTITCVRGKKVKHVTAVKPRCPIGWKLKKK